jgi:hypothetical protein
MRARVSSAAAMRTTIPSALTQHAPSGPARTNSKSRGPYGLAKFSFARLILCASHSLSDCGAGQNKKPGAMVFRPPGCSLGRVRFVLRISPDDECPALDPAAGGAGDAQREGARRHTTRVDSRDLHRAHRGGARMRGPPRRDAPFDLECVRHAKPPPFVTPSRANRARPKTITSLPRRKLLEGEHLTFRQFRRLTRRNVFQSGEAYCVVATPACADAVSSNSRKRIAHDEPIPWVAKPMARVG